MSLSIVEFTFLRQVKASFLKDSRDRGAVTTAYNRNDHSNVHFPVSVRLKESEIIKDTSDFYMTLFQPTQVSHPL